VVELEDLTGTADHWKATIVSAAFAGKSALARHRLINAALADELRGPIHALSMDCKAPRRVVGAQLATTRPVWQPSMLHAKVTLPLAGAVTGSSTGVFIGRALSGPPTRRISEAQPAFSSVRVNTRMSFSPGLAGTRLGA
jgi:acid stress-induced BolA-like protein IbaG/YrbA